MESGENPIYFHANAERRLLMAKAESKILAPDALGEIVRAGKSETLVFFGEEDYLKTVWSERIAKAVMTAEGFEIFNRFNISFSDEKSGLSSLTDALFASPMMQEHTLIEVCDLSSLAGRATAIDALAGALSGGSGDAVVILNFRSDELDADYRFEQTALYKKLSPVAKFVKFDLLSEGKLVTWAKKLISDKDKRLYLTDEGALALISLCSGRMLAILSETEKLAAYKNYAVTGEATPITEEDVRTVCVQNAKDDMPFAMSNAAAKWNLREMLAVFDFCRDMREEPVSVIAKLGKIYSEMLKMKTALMSGLSVTAAAKSLGMNEYRARIVARSVENVPLSVIENAVLLAYRTDVALKSTQTDKWVLLDKLAAEIYTPKSLRG